MANFFLDNEDIQFLFNHIDLGELARIQEDGFAAGNGRDDYGPTDAADAVDNYRRILTIIGEVAGEMIAPNAETVDREGNTLNDDGTVTLHPLVQDNLRRLTQADLMGFTLPRKYGGLNCPTLIYTMATEIISRADTSLMNLFGLQGIAETIYAFANDEIRDEVLPRFCRGEVTGAMVLTEPDAGSDLQAVRLRAYQDDKGQWFLNGVKRFITNGCGEILLVLARSEPEISDGRGLSLFITERSEKVRVRHLENKLGIHGSPTCELVFDDTPARLIGERQRGLITYVMALMNGARVGIAAQSLGLAEAAYRFARTYAHTRQQFGGPIERFPAVAELVTDMKIDVEAARALAYETARVCDHENNNARALEWKPNMDKEEQKQRKQAARGFKRLNSMLTPMSKYYCSEMCNRARLQHDPGVGRVGLHEGLRRGALHARRPDHDHLRGHQPIAVRRRRPRRLLRGPGDMGRAVGEEGLRRPAVGRAEAEARRGQAADRRGDPVHQDARRLLPRPFRPAAGRCVAGGRHRAFALGARRGQRAEEAGRPAVHSSRVADGADQLRADSQRRHDADGAIRPLGRPRAGGGVRQVPSPSGSEQPSVGARGEGGAAA